jgi:hypothetical protein
VTSSWKNTKSEKPVFFTIPIFTLVFFLPFFLDPHEIFRWWYFKTIFSLAGINLLVLRLHNNPVHTSERALPEPTYDRLSFSENVDVASRHFYTLAELGLGVAA